MVKLVDKELYSETIKKVLSKDLTQKEAGLILDITDRQIRRLITKYKNMGEDAFVHKNINNQNAKKISDDIPTKIIDDYLTNYYDYGFTHFYEEQGRKYGISFSYMVEKFGTNYIISPYAQHRTVKLYNENMKKAIRDNSITESQEKLFEQRKQEEFEKHIRKSSLHYSFGEEVQMDAAFWVWFGTEETALHLVVDKATKKVLAGYFDYEETTNAYLVVLMNMIINFGIPKRIKTDRRNSFSINNAKSSKSKLNITQFGRICEDLEIELLCNSNPLFKPNAERENGTFKRRLKAELRHNGITTIEEANKYLNEVFIPKINERFSYKINPKKNVMRENNYTEDELNLIISIRNERTIDNASSIKYFNNYYLPANVETGEVISFKSGTKCTVVNSYDSKLFGIIDGNTYMLVLIEKREGENKRATKNGFKPNENHPWRNFKIN
ncbi:MAG: ISNCY family transposase [Firmicutes bacterium]|nr:ISNCY family transposase [Candidatus Alectryobacillus merdavium]